MVSLRSSSSQPLTTSGGAVPAGRGAEGPEKDAMGPDTLAMQLEALLANPLVRVLLQQQAELAAQATASQRLRADLVPGGCYVSERELQRCLPWTVKTIRARRKADLIPAIKDHTKVGGREEYLYNTYEVLAAIQGTGPGRRPVVRRIPDDLEVEPLTSRMTAGTA